MNRKVQEAKRGSRCCPTREYRERAEATEAAAEFLLSPASVQAMVERLGVPDLQAVRTFEALLETLSAGGTARASRIVVHRASL